VCDLIRYITSHRAWSYDMQKVIANDNISVGKKNWKKRWRMKEFRYKFQPTVMVVFSGGSRNLREGGGAAGPPRSLPLPPLRSRAPKNQLEVWGTLSAPPVGYRSPGRKRIRCTLKLSESRWWQSFWIFWVPCLTVERSKFSISWPWVTAP